MKTQLNDFLQRDQEIIYKPIGNPNVIGTGGMDSIYGTEGNDTILGKNGDDTIAGEYGGLGNDLILGGNGHDTIGGDIGPWWNQIEGGNDTISGGAGNDRIIGHGGENILYGGSGDDVLIAGIDSNSLNGGSGTDLFILTAGKDKIKNFNASEGDTIAISSETSFVDLKYSKTNRAVRISYESGQVLVRGNVDEIKVFANGIDFYHDDKSDALYPSVYSPLSILDEELLLRWGPMIDNTFMPFS